MARELVKYSMIDTFTDIAFKGNPSVACLLEEEKDVEWLQKVAIEFNQAVTCYLTRLNEDFELKIDHFANGVSVPKFRLCWFTRDGEEISICGHATLAASHFIFSYVSPDADTVEFSTLSGILTAKKIPDTNCYGDSSKSFFIELNFPMFTLVEYDEAEVPILSKILNSSSVMEIKQTTVENYLLVVLPSGEAVGEVEPKFDELKNYPARGVIVTGPAPQGSGFDFFTRFFCPNLGVNEDHVCGSANCALAPYWCKRLGKSDLVGYQASRRSGVINVHLDEKNERVFIRGKAIVVMEGSILV